MKELLFSLIFGSSIKCFKKFSTISVGSYAFFNSSGTSILIFTKEVSMPHLHITSHFSRPLSRRLSSSVMRKKGGRKMRIFAILLTALMLAACATPYQRIGLGGGYSETQLGKNIFQVSFRGNGYTSREKASDFSLLRSAELTLERGFRYFVIVGSEKDTKISTYTSPTQSSTTGSAYGYGNYAYGSATTTTYGGQTYFISKPRATNTILCFKEKPDINGIVFEAEFVVKSIRQKYGIGK
jgi:hypothetical protein